MNVGGANLGILSQQAIRSTAAESQRPEQVEQGELSQEDRDKIKVAQQFEAIFLRQLLSQMQGSSQGGAIQQSQSNDMYKGMGQEALAEHISTQSEGVGIAHSLLKHWGVKQV